MTQAEFYSMPMRAAILRMLVLASLMLMPFGMAAASAAPVQEHRMAMAMPMPMEHCPDGDQKSHSSGTLATCTMACSAALPASAPKPGPSIRVEREAVAQLLAPTLSGIELEIATPPPRLS